TKAREKRVSLEMKVGPVDANGVCPPEKFDNVMKTAEKEP
ncbi:hypothetical protein, partial [Salmonella enterica]